MQEALIRILISTTLCSLVSSASKINSVTYGPSLVSLTRWDRLVRGPTIFNPDTGRVISLEDYPNYSVVIPLAPDSPTATSNQVFISRRVSGPGEFSVEAPPGYGVMAVIQSLDLRVAEDACNDFILFSEVDGTTTGGVESTGTCGKVDIRDTSSSPQGLVGPRNFISPSGRMKILFYHGFIWGLVRNFNFDIFDSSLNPDLKVEIAFTAYKDCPSLNSTKNLNASSSASNSFATCSPSVPNSKTCIKKELFCDKTLNCAFTQDFGSDEDSVQCSDNSGKFSQKLRQVQLSLNSTSTSTTTTTTTKGTTSTTENPTNTTSSSTSPPPVRKLNSISSTTTEKFVEIKHNVKGTGADAAGLIGLVRRFPLGVEQKVHQLSKAVISRVSAVVQASLSPSPQNRSESRLLTKNKGKQSSVKMPLEKGDLFADVNADPIEDPLVNGLTKEETILLQEENEAMSTNTIIGIASVAGIVLVLIGILRVYYCYNKVIWNPHGNSRLKSNEESPPETPNTNLMRKMKALAMESEEVFKEKKGKGLKEQPPSYEILFNNQIMMYEEKLEKEIEAYEKV